MRTPITCHGQIPDSTDQWSTNAANPGWYTIYIPDRDSHGSNDGLRVLGAFTYRPGSQEPCHVEHNNCYAQFTTFTAAVAWCGLVGDHATAVARHLTAQLAPSTFLQLITMRIDTTGDPGRHIITAVVNAATELESGRGRPADVILNEIIDAARTLLPH